MDPIDPARTARSSSRGPGDVHDQTPILNRVYRDEQAMHHGRAARLLLVPSIVLALYLAWALRSAVPATWWRIWLGVMAVAWTLRIAVHRRMSRTAFEGPARSWLLAAYGLHGVGWGLAACGLFVLPDPGLLDLLVLALVGVFAGAVLSTSFDRGAAFSFGTPLLLPLVAYLVSRGEMAPPGTAPVALLLLVAASAASWRAGQSFRRAVEARVAEAERADEALHAARLLDRTGALARVGAWEFDVGTRRVRLSPQAAEVLELSDGADLPVEEVWRRFADLPREEVEAALAHTLRSGERLELELPLTTPGGRAVVLRVVGEARRGGDRVTHVDGAVQDVTRLHAADRALADQHQLLRQVLQTTRQGVWFVDTSGITTELNPAMCELLGRPREQVLGQPAAAFFAGEDLTTLKRELAARRAGAYGAYEVGITRPDGSRVQCLNNASPLVDTAGRRIGSVGVWTDISTRHAAEATLRLYERIVNATGELLSVVDVDERYVAVNDAWLRATGTRREQVLGRTGMEVLPDVDHRQRRQALHECLATRRVTRVRDVLALGGRDGVHVQTDYYPYQDAAGGSLHVVMVSRDVTDEAASRAALEASAAEQRALLDAFPGYIAVVDTAYTYVYVNDRLARLLGRGSEQVTGLNLRQVLGDERGHAVQSIVDEALREGRSVSESHYPPTAGREALDLEVLHIAGPRRVDGTRHVYAFGVDITARKRAQVELGRALAEAERANRAKSVFLSSMSHELRTPLHAVLGFGQLLAQQSLGETASRQVTEVLRGGRHLQSLIDDLLDLGRIESGHLEVSPARVPLPALLEECRSQIQPLADGHGVTVTLDLPGHPLDVQADPQRLRQVVMNLLSNAVKYNRRHGQVRLQARESGTQIEIRVHDTGPGLDAAQRDKLFRPFERLAAVEGGVDGTGVGLALSRYLVLAMGGAIGVDSQPGEGSQFWVRLTRLAPEPPAAEPAPATSGDTPAPGRLPAAASTAPMPLQGGVPDAPRRRALHIDDNPINLMLVAAMLEEEYELHSATDPRAGLEMATLMRPDVVLLDIQMPGMDGYEVLRRLQHDARTRHIPVVAVSANAMPSDVAAGQRAGFTAYLTKPLDMDDLLGTLRHVLQPGQPVGQASQA